MTPRFSTPRSLGGRGCQRQPRGFALVEVLVVLSLLGFLLAGVYGVLTIGFRSTRGAEVFETVHGEALVGMRKIREELSLTSKATVNSLAAAPDHIIFASPQRLLSAPNHTTYSYDTNGNLEWHKWVCIFRDSATRTVFRTEIDLGFAPAAPPLAATQPPLSDFQALLGGDRRTLLRNCEKLEFRDGAINLGSIGVVLETSQNVNTDKETLVRLEDEVLPRNEP